MSRARLTIINCVTCPQLGRCGQSAMVAPIEAATEHTPAASVDRHA